MAERKRKRESESKNVLCHCCCFPVIDIDKWELNIIPLLTNSVFALRTEWSNQMQERANETAMSSQLVSNANPQQW